MRALVLAALAGCGGMPNLAGDGGDLDAPSRASLSITPDQTAVALAAPTPFTITNEGEDTTGPLGLEILGTDSTSFSLGDSTCSVLTAHASCTVAVRFTPRATGALTAKLRAFDGPIEASARLTATGDTALVIIPPTQGFLPTAVDNDSPPAIFTVRNLGAATTGKLILALDNVNPQFTFVHQMDTCTGAMLANGEECTVALAFSPRLPSTMLSRTGTLSARDGNGAAALSQLAATVGRLAFTPGTGATFSGSACGAPPPGATISITNETWKALGSLTFAIANPNQTAFTFTTTCLPQQPGTSTCTVTVSLIPATSYPPPVTGTLTIKASQDNASSTQTLTLGAGVTACDLAVSPSSITFPSTAVGTTSSGIAVTVANNGTVSHAITATLGGSDPTEFQIIGNQCATLIAGATCMIGVAAKPTTAGAHGATLAITTPGLAPPPVTLLEDATNGFTAAKP